MKRYFRNEFDRIQIVDAEYDDAFDGFDNEIAETDLPENFDEWLRYEHYGIDHGSVTVMSENGD